MSSSNLQPMTGLQRLMEGGLILSTIVALFMLMALATFHPADPGWSQTAWDGPVSNAMGAVGAWIADILFFVFGLTAYLVPPVCAAIGWLAFHQAYRLAELDYFSVGLRVIGFLLTVLSFAALASMNADDLHYFSAGGVVGDVVSAAMLPYFNLLGTTLFLLCFIGAGFTLMTGISWLTVAEKVGEGTIALGLMLWNLPRHFSHEDRDTEDTRGFMELVDRFKRRKDQDHDDDDEVSGASETNQYQEQPGWQAFDDAEPVLKREPEFSAEPILDSEVRIEPELAPPWVGGPEPESSADDAKPALEPYLAAAMDKAGVTLPEVPTTPMPTLELLDRPNKSQNPISQEELDAIARLVEAKLLDFNVTATVVDVHPGPVITRFELDLAPGVKVSKITNLAKDLARALSAVSVRVVEVIPGKSVIGLELPNKFREIVYLRDVLDSERFEQAKSDLTMVLGQDISGYPVVVDLAKMPHLLVAGTTGSGKSVGVNVMILSLLYKSTPEEVRLIMIDPKMLELSVYEGIPHLLCEVVTDMKEASNALRWCVGEMERRYKLMSALGVRNLKGYNAKVLEAREAGEPIKDPFWQPEQSMATEAPELEKLPAIVVVVDEFADMMMIVGKKVEELIARIAQKARAAGIHLILATQRPSVDVITGLIKANIPTRIAFQVSSRVDSRTILDQQGAEQLLGQGDMLYLPPGTGVPIRVHGAFVDDHEVHKVVADWAARGKPQYIDEILAGETGGEQILLPGEAAENGEDADPLYDEAVAFVLESRRASISSVQRKLKIGYNRAARLVEQMEQSGLVSPPGHNGNRDVLVPGPQQ
ncbi:DNA translocase FtsK 4TM domain-containing protein [Ferrimonas balearica]|uniref:DNA translocase FtsK n=1 Tax=Ferrimonas balearica TaxID=44012 RepID=UPI001C98AA16|nr:DNA translocase FtsK 4TM domain-containing protein [Ferrimonas balearica]MBY6106151.1 DNA translocase FtsK 4TM domain-containing protein [Ferrimonas balearica]